MDHLPLVTSSSQAMLKVLPLAALIYLYTVAPPHICALDVVCVGRVGLAHIKREIRILEPFYRQVEYKLGFDPQTPLVNQPIFTFPDLFVTPHR